MRVKIFVIFVQCCLCCLVTLSVLPNLLNNKNESSNKKKYSAQKKGWQEIYFKEINTRAKLSGLSSLRRVKLSADEIELRIWVGFGVIPLEGFVIKKYKGEWSGLHIRSVNKSLSRQDYQTKVKEPKQGWDNLWQNIKSKGIETLPDSSELNGAKLAFDGESIVVEVNNGGTYRTYLYSNPAIQSWPEAKTALEITQTVTNSFGVDRKLWR